jgi:hypothetical protein
MDRFSVRVFRKSDDADYFTRILDGSWTVRVRTTYKMILVFFWNRIRFSEDWLDDITKMLRKKCDS